MLGIQATCIYKLVSLLHYFGPVNKFLLLLFSPKVVSDSLWPQGLHQARLLCPLLCPQSLLKFMSIESVMPSSHFVLCHSLLLPSVFPSIRVFSKESVLRIRWSKYWSFNISPSNEYSEVISFRIYWCDLLAVQGTHKSLFQHHSSKASIPCCTTKDIPTQ